MFQDEMVPAEDLEQIGVEEDALILVRLEEEDEEELDSDDTKHYKRPPIQMENTRVHI